MATTNEMNLDVYIHVRTFRFRMTYPPGSCAGHKHMKIMLHLTPIYRQNDLKMDIVIPLKWTFNVSK